MIEYQDNGTLRILVPPTDASADLQNRLRTQAEAAIVTMDADIQPQMRVVVDAILAASDKETQRVQIDEMIKLIEEQIRRAKKRLS